MTRKKSQLDATVILEKKDEAFELLPQKIGHLRKSQEKKKTKHAKKTSNTKRNPQKVKAAVKRTTSKRTQLHMCFQLVPLLFVVQICFCGGDVLCVFLSASLAMLHFVLENLEITQDTTAINWSSTLYARTPEID